jgi:predicted Zn finger-like uncharacterized protein
MPIPATCPHCRKSYTLADQLAGKQVRCKSCAGVFVVPGSEPAQGLGRQGTENIDEGVVLRVRRRPEAAHVVRAPNIDMDEPVRVRRPGDDDEPRPRRRRSSNQGLVIGLVAGGVGLILVTAGIVVAVVVANRDKDSGSATNSPTVEGGKGLGPMLGLGGPAAANPLAVLDPDLHGPWPEPIMPGHIRMVPGQTVTLHIAKVVDRNTSEGILDRIGAMRGGQSGAVVSATFDQRMTVLVCPVADAADFAKKVDFGTVHSVSGSVITISARKFEGPPDNADDVTRALFRLKSPNAARRTEAAASLARVPPGQRRDEVARALVALIDDPDAEVRRQALNALGVWGTAESVPALITAIRKEWTGDHAIRALARLKDERAIEPIAAAIETPFTRHEANVALKEFGTKAEKAVLPFLEHRDRDIRNEACDILKKCGTRQSIPALQRVAADPDPGLSRMAKDTIKEIMDRP